MKKFLAIIFTIFFGLFISIIVTSFFIGTKASINSLKIGTLRMFNSINSPEKNVQTSIPSGLILGESETLYSDLRFENIEIFKSELVPAPFIVPSDGIAGHQNFLFSNDHDGIDIWTQSNGKGIDGKTSKGSPVYAACSGKVTRIFHPNEEIEIICDSISEDYKDIVPSLKVKTLYSHLGDGITHTPFHSLKIGQTVKQGELIGFQGNISFFAPENRISHLHFGIYDLTKNNRPALDPTSYIGVSCNKAGQIFETSNK